MTTRLIDENWGEELRRLAENCGDLRIICPFIKTRGLEYLHINNAKNIQVITRFNEPDFYSRVSDIEALRQLLESDAEIRGLQRLHSKVYLFGKSCAVITSANLTQSAMTSNHEFGVASEDTEIISKCHEYFDVLWERSGDNLTHKHLSRSEEAVKQAVDESEGAPPQPKNLKDRGSNARNAAISVHKTAMADDSEGPQAFIKFFGGAASGDRVPLSSLVIDEIKYSDCHWAVCSSVRPHLVKDSAIIFIGRMTKKPNDITIFGRAVGMKHIDKRDVAKPEEVKRISWKKDWPYYTRVYDVKFVKGALKNGVSLYKMEDALKHNALWPTQKNYREGNTRTNPRQMHRLSALQLTPKSWDWLEDRLQAAFDKHGCLTEFDLRESYDLDWPDLKKLGLG